MKENRSSAKPKVAASLEEVTFLELLRTTDQFSRELSTVLKPDDISPSQYNVLRILRGSPNGLACGEISSRMITRDPDITRLLDRMEKRGWTLRFRDEHDRRVVKVRITGEGLKLVASLDKPVEQAHRQQLGHLSREQLRSLCELLRNARANR
ncbi:MAG TPA: MarR family transcriptional regulator [Terriglobales bacterium]|nr:MarR family transcriptional regulator [Terriglobales bacterium]